MYTPPMAFFLPSLVPFHTHLPPARESIVSKCSKGIQESNLWEIEALVNLVTKTTEYIVLNIISFTKSLQCVIFFILCNYM